MESVKPGRYFEGALTESDRFDDEMARLTEVTERLAGAEEGARARILAYLNARFAAPRAPRAPRTAKR